MRQSRIILIMALSLLVYSAVTVGAQPRYAVTDLGTFQPSAIAGPYVVGSENGLPVRLNIDTGHKEVLAHYGHGGVANDVIPDGATVGTVKRPDSQGVVQDWATFWRPDGTFTHLQGSLPSRGLAINESWTMTGSTTCANGQRAVRWWADGRTEECVSPFAVGDGIDAQHRVWASRQQTAAVWMPSGVTVDLSHSAGVVLGVVRVAQGGTALYDGRNFNPVIVSFDGTEVLSFTGANCVGEGINSHEHVVGGCRLNTPPPVQAVLWRDGQQIDLNTQIEPASGWRLEHALAISDDGVIAGHGTLNGATRYFLLTPIPVAPMVALTVNQAAFAPGQTLTATVTTQDAAGYDLYVGAIFPDGDTTLLLTQLSPLQGQVVRLSSNPALFPPVIGPAQPTQAFSHTFTGLETPGTYHLVAALVPPGAFQDGVIHGEDLVGFDWTAISLQITPLHAKVQAIQAKHTRR